jgi:hypothetical protein
MIITLLIVAALLAVVLLLAVLQPKDFCYERRAVVAASPEEIFPHVNELKRWLAWSPWEKMDPAMRRTFAGPPAGIGAVYAWDGNRQIGAGRMTVTDSQPATLVRIRLEFFRPFACINRVEFTFRKTANGTAVTWSMAGTNKFIGRVMGVFINMDKMCGTQFAEGLENLRRVVERSAAVPGPA